MRIKGKDLTTTVFRDSFLLIPIKLAKFVETFGLDIETKLYFPYHWNRVNLFFNNNNFVNLGRKL